MKASKNESEHFVKLSDDVCVKCTFFVIPMIFLSI